MVSIIIPVYNAEKYLSRTIECLKKQTYTEFEVLLIDDGSKDNSATIMQKTAAEDVRFRYIHQENQGVSAARNHGLACCNGQYITFLDADDIFPENYLYELLHTLEVHECEMSVCDVCVLENGKETKRFSCKTKQLSQKDALELLLCRKEINSGPCAKLFHADILKNVSFPPLKLYEDMLFNLEAMSRCNRIASTSKTEYGYIQNEGSAMSNAKKVPNKDVITATEKVLDFIKSKKELSAECVYTTLSHLMQYVQPLIGMQDDTTRDFVKHAQELYKRHRGDIRSCQAFTRKEKMYYLLFSRGWIYQNKRILRVR